MMKVVEIQDDNPLAVALVSAIRQGDVDAVGSLVREHAGLASARIRDAEGGTRSLLHVVTDWPGYFPDGPQIVRLLIDAGGADIEAPGASIACGTPLDDAVGYGCWNVARLLVERGARVESLWHAAALGMTARVEELLDADPPPSRAEIDHAFWQACDGGQRRTAEYLFARGADIDAIPDHSKHTPLDIAAGPDTRREAVVSWLREHGARSAQETP